MSQSSLELLSLLEQVYADADAYHAHLELELEVFMNFLLLVIHKNVPATFDDEVHIGFLKRLNTNDLYLTLACAQSGEKAWRRLNALYGSCIRRLAASLCRKRDLADELANGMLTYLFLPNKAGEKRITSYQGLSPLENWLAIIIHNRAIEEWKSPFHQFEPLDAIHKLGDKDSTERIDNVTRSRTYYQMANDSLDRACRVLNDRDKWLLTLRYKDQIQVKRIAEMAKLDSTTITYHIKQAREKFRKELCSILKKEYKLNEFALKECIEDILSNPAYSLLSLIRAE